MQNVLYHFVRMQNVLYHFVRMQNVACRKACCKVFEVATSTMHTGLDLTYTNVTELPW